MPIESNWIPPRRSIIDTVEVHPGTSFPKNIVDSTIYIHNYILILTLYFFQYMNINFMLFSEKIFMILSGN